MFGLGESFANLSEVVTYEEYKQRQQNCIKENIPSAPGIVPAAASSSGGSCVEHFFEKLLRIKDLMITGADSVITARYANNNDTVR